MYPLLCYVTFSDFELHRRGVWRRSSPQVYKTIALQFVKMPFLKLFTCPFHFVLVPLNTALLPSKTPSYFDFVKSIWLQIPHLNRSPKNFRCFIRKIVVNRRTFLTFYIVRIALFTAHPVKIDSKLILKIQYLQIFINTFFIFVNVCLYLQ